MYRTLELWVQVSGASASILQGSPGHSELLFSHLLGDVTPGAESVKVSSITCVLQCKFYRFSFWPEGEAVDLRQKFAHNFSFNVYFCFSTLLIVVSNDLKTMKLHIRLCKKEKV